jgi:hypothetical protein
MTEAEGAAAIAARSSGAGEGHARAATTTTVSSPDGSSAASNDVSSSANASGGGSADDENTTQRIVSPFSEQGGTTNEFPSQYLCPIVSGEPPVVGAYFDVPGADNQLSAQVFEYSALYRFIASNTRWPSRGFAEVRHPINGGVKFSIHQLERG